MPDKSLVGVLASKKTKAEFAEELSKYTQLTADEIKELFPNKSDRKGLIELLKIIDSAADENEMKSEIVSKISLVGNIIVKLTKRFILGV